MFELRILRSGVLVATFRDCILMFNTRYSYASRSKAISTTSNKAKQILRTRDIKKLEKFIIEGHGYQLIGECSSDPKIRNLIKNVPFYMARIDMLHDAISKGQLRNVQILLNTVSPSLSLLKPKAGNLVLSTDSTGAGLLHKAVYYNYPDIIEWLIRNYPSTIQVRDKLGRIPLHYVNSTSEPDKYWDLLVSAGSPVNVKDVYDKPPRFYFNEETEIHLPKKTRDCDLQNDEFSIKSSNIRIWIHDQDINKLQRIIWEGYGEKLKMQTSSKNKMKKFLDGVPHIMEVIREIHAAAIENDVNSLMKLCKSPVPRVIVKSKDTNGITALHKACGLGHRQIVDFILELCPDAVHVCDNDSRTPIHYAAAFNRREIYKKLIKYGANENIIDKNGKTAKCYQSRTTHINVRLLHQMPSGSRLGTSNLHPSFDWTLLRIADTEEKIVHLPESPQNSTFATLKEEETINLQDNDEVEIICNSVNVRKVESMINPDDEVIVNTEKEDLCFKIVEQAETEVDDSANDDVIKQIPPDNSIDQIDDDDVQSNSTAICEESKPNSSSNSKEDSSSKVLGIRLSHLHSTPKMDHLNEISDTGLNTVESHFFENENNVQNNIRNVAEMNRSINAVSGDDSLNEIRRFILEGHGELLVNSKSENSRIQAFLNHLPIYLKKIELIHYCCEIGDLEELRKCLDRRNMVIARENKTGLYLTPLHVAVLYNRRHIARYLGGRFPETFKMTDKLGRTPLHLAAMHPHGTYVYNLLLTLGADKMVKDDNGYTPQFYYENPGLYLKNILEHIKKSKILAIEENKCKSDVTNEFSKKNSQVSSVKLKDDKKMRGVTPLPHTIKSIDDNSKQFDVEKISSPTSSIIDEVDEIMNVSVMNRNPNAANQFQPISRDRYGRTAIHKAASKKHSRNAFLQLLKDLNMSIAYRDQFYRTARDVAALSELYDNVKAIDAFVLHIAANGETDKIIDLMTDGYDHILDTETDENIIDVVVERNHTRTMIVLQTINLFEQVRESLHSAIRQGFKLQVVEIFRKCRKDAPLMAMCKNDMFRCSLHIAVLTGRRDIVRFIIKKYPATLHIGDNLERTSLHYAMALSTIEELSRILIQAGANRTAKDLKGRQPVYYFVNKTDILHMQQEEKRLMERESNRIH